MPTEEQKKKFINTLKGLTTFDGSPDNYYGDLLSSVCFYNKGTGNFHDYSANNESVMKTPNHIIGSLSCYSTMDDGYFVVPSANGPMAVGMDDQGETFVKDIDTMISEIPAPKGNPLVRWFKLVMNKINDDWFYEDAMEEIFYNDKIKKLKTFKKTQDYKLDPEEQRKVAKVRSYNKKLETLQELSFSPQQYAEDMINHIKSYTVDGIRDNADLRSEFVKYMTVKVLSEGDAETIKAFLQGPLSYEHTANNGALEKMKDFAANFPGYRSDYQFNDPEATMKAMEKLNTVSLSEPELSGLHVTAGICASILSKMVANSGMKLNPDQQKLLDINNNTLLQLGSIYVKGLKSEITMLSGKKSTIDPQTNQVNNKLSLNDVDKTNILIKETVNTLLSDSKANMDKGNKNNLPLQILTDKNFSEGNIKTMVVNSDVCGKFKTVGAMENLIISNVNLKKDATQKIVANGVKAFSDFKKSEQVKAKQKTEVKGNIKKEDIERNKAAVTTYKPPTNGF